MRLEAAGEARRFYYVISHRGLPQKATIYFASEETRGLAMLTHTEWITWVIIPAIGLLLGAAVVFAAIRMSRAFNRRYGVAKLDRLSRDVGDAGSAKGAIPSNAQKRINGSLKLFATGLNNVAVLLIGGAFINPILGNGGTVLWTWIPVAAALHLGGHIILHRHEFRAIVA